MQRQTSSENSCQHDLIADHLNRSLAQRSLDNVGLIVERTRNLITHHLANTLHITAKTHRIALHLAVADLGNELVENGVSFT